MVNMMLIRTERFNEYINSDEIVRLVADPKGVPVAYLRDETTVRLAPNDSLDMVAIKTAPVISAVAGFEALYVVRLDEAPWIYVIRHPVLGWRSCPYGGLHPVVLDDETASNVSFAGVKYPDGRVICPAVASYESEEEWFKAESEGVGKAA